MPVVVTVSSHPGLEPSHSETAARKAEAGPPAAAAASSSPAFSSIEDELAHCRAKLQTLAGGSKDDFVTGRQQWVITRRLKLAEFFKHFRIKHPRDTDLEDAKWWR